MANGFNSYTSYLACLVSGLHTLSAIKKKTILESEPNSILAWKIQKT